MCYPPALYVLFRPTYFVYLFIFSIYLVLNYVPYITHVICNFNLMIKIKERKISQIPLDFASTKTKILFIENISSNTVIAEVVVVCIEVFILAVCCI